MRIYEELTFSALFVFNENFIFAIFAEMKNSGIFQFLKKLILSISLDTFSTPNSKQAMNQHFEMEQIYMERSGMYICSISGAAGQAAEVSDS